MADISPQQRELFDQLRDMRRRIERLDTKEFGAGGGNVGAFLDLSDAPSSYVGAANYFVRVNTAGTALAFDTVDWDDVQGKPSTFTPSAHTHDDRYYTKSELNSSGGAGSVHWDRVTNKPSTFAPSTHAASHRHGGSDEIGTATPAANAIPKANSSGKLDSWVSVATSTTPGLAAFGTADFNLAGGTVAINDGGIDHGSISGLGDDDHTQYHNDARGDERYFTRAQLATSGGGGTVHWDNLSSKPSTFTPSAHAASHKSGGSDPIGTATPTANAIPYANGSGRLDAWISTASTTTRGLAAFSSAYFSVSNGTVSLVSSGDHGALSGLGDDDHTQYMHLAGRVGAQSLNGDVNLLDTVFVGRGTGQADLLFTGGAGAFRGAFYRTGSSNRWTLGADSTPESGANTGSDFSLVKFLDNNVRGTVFTVSRASGNVTFNHKIFASNIEDGADVTDAANVAGAGAVMASALIATSAGTADAGKAIKLDADGHVDASMINDADISLDNVTEGTTNKFFTATLKDKLDNIEAGADVTANATVDGGSY